MTKLSDLGIVYDTDEFQKQLIALVFSLVRSIVVMLAAILTVILMIVWIRHCGKRREPRARKGRKRT